jgi:CRP-like cAMP-binding protein
MADYALRSDLHAVLERGCERLRKPKQTVLFHRGERAFGLFIVLSGAVKLDFGVDSTFAHFYGPGALVGLPATLTRRPYSMTATVTQDAELGFWSPEALDALLRKRPELCQPLLVLLGQRMAENDALHKAFLTNDAPPAQQSSVV